MRTIEEEIKQTKEFRSLQERAYVNLIYTSNQLADRLREVFEEHDITNQQFNVLRILRGAGPKPLFCNQIKEVMLDKNPDITRLCNRLEDKGLVTRSFNESNRRQVNVTITPKGLELLTSLDPVVEKHMRALTGLSEQEAEQLCTLLDKMRVRV